MNSASSLVHNAPPRRSLLRTALVIAAVLAAVYLLAASWVWSRQPTVAFDPVARMQELTPRAESGADAWTAYKSALKWMRADGQGRGFGLSELMNLTLDTEPGKPMWTTVAPMLDAHADQLKALRAAAAMPTLGYVPRIEHAAEDLDYFGLEPTTSNSPLEQEFPAIAITLPYLGELRAAGRLLRLDALLAAERGKGSQAVDDVEAILRVGAHCSQLPVLLGSLVQYSLITSAAHTAVAALALKPDAFKQADLKRLDELFASITPEVTRMHVDGERVMMDDMLQRLYTDDGDGSGRLIPGGAARLMTAVQMIPADGVPESGPFAATAFLLGPVLVLNSQTRAETRQEWDGVLAEAASQSVLPQWRQAFPRADALFAAGPRTESVSFSPAAILTPAVSSAANSASRTRIYPAIARTQVALERFKRDKGRWPEMLNELVPGYLPSVPQDEFANAPLMYAVAGGKPRIWSVGKNQSSDESEGDDIVISR